MHGKNCGAGFGRDAILGTQWGDGWRCASGEAWAAYSREQRSARGVIHILSHFSGVISEIELPLPVYSFLTFLTFGEDEVRKVRKNLSSPHHPIG